MTDREFRRAKCTPVGAVRVGFVALLLAIGVGCSSEEARPPEYGSDAGAVANPKTCKEARAGSASGSVVLVDGQIAGCVGDGVVCSLADVAGFASVCKVGKPSATCTSDRWQIECVDLDASPDGA